jgi:hypothetical protein
MKEKLFHFTTRPTLKHDVGAGGGGEAVRLWFCTPSPQAVNSWPHLHDTADSILTSGRVIAPTATSGEIWNLPLPRTELKLQL